MNLTTIKPYIRTHYIFVFLILVIFLGVSYADSLPEVITELGIRIEQESLKITPVSPSKAKIIGRVKKAWWTGHDIRRESYRTKEPVYAGSVNSRGERPIAYYKNVRKERTSRWPSKTELYNPSNISIDIPYLTYKSEVDVMSDGQFSGYLELKDGYYFSKNRNVEAGYSWWRSKHEVVFSSVNPKNSSRYSGINKDTYKQKIMLYSIDVDDSLAENLLTKVRIEFAEKNSRVPITPNVRIKIEDGPTYKSIKAEWKKKYDDTVVKKLVNKFERIKKDIGKRIIDLDKGDVMDFKNRDTIEFLTLTGSSFKVETRDQNFYYFKGVVKADKAPLFKSTVLLVEIGDKMRSDDEGHGGQIIPD